jgi:hypothetical protein
MRECSPTEPSTSSYRPGGTEMIKFAWSGVLAMSQRELRRRRFAGRGPADPQEVSKVTSATGKPHPIGLPNDPDKTARLTQRPRRVAKAVDRSSILDDIDSVVGLGPRARGQANGLTGFR